jgi:hypothetical protein
MPSTTTAPSTTTTPSTTPISSTPAPSSASGAPAPAGPAPLEFGIYPGGAAGGDSGSNPDDTEGDLAAVEALKAPEAPFVVHLYAEYYGPGSYSVAQEVGPQIDMYAQAGIQVELVLCYRPADMNPAADVPGFVAWQQAALAQYGPELRFLQVTNEANVTNAPGSSDGYYPGADQALVDGVIAAKQEIDSDGLSTAVGINWAYALDPGEMAWWSNLASLGGEAFINALDWVGIDVYPGTWGPTLSPELAFGPAVAAEMTSALQILRDTYMPLAGIPASVPIHVSEAGYPTGPDRSDASQTTALQNEVEAVNAVRLTDNVSDFRWFDLRDAITDSTDFTDQYGLMTDTDQPKPAFVAYQQLIALLGVAG